MTDPIHHYFGRNGVIAANALMEGGAIGYLFGPAAGACATITSVALTYLSDRPLESSHIPLNSTGLSGACDKKELGKAILPQIVVLIFFSTIGIMPKDPVSRILQHSFATRTAVLSTCFRICVITPIVEGLAYRGFLQDRIHDIQFISQQAETADPGFVRDRLHNIQCIFQQAETAIRFLQDRIHDIQSRFQQAETVETAASEPQQNVPNYIQAALSALIHLEPRNGLEITKLAGIFFKAKARGELKEKSHHLTSSISSNSMDNTMVSLRVAVFGI